MSEREGSQRERTTPTGARATVVVVNYNGAHLLPPCLDGLRRQDTPPGFFDTVVVDNASVDGSRELLARDYPEVRVIASPVNTGFAGGNNLALREVTTPYAVLLNNDAVPEPDWLRRLLAPFDEPGAERLGVVTGKVVFAPRFLPLRLTTAGFSPGPQDPRELGVRLLAVEVDGRDVTEKVLWEQLSYGPEGSGAARFRWTRPSGTFLVPVQDAPGAVQGSVKVTFRWAAERDKPVTVTGDGVALTAHRDRRRQRGGARGVRRRPAGRRGQQRRQHRAARGLRRRPRLPGAGHRPVRRGRSRSSPPAATGWRCAPRPAARPAGSTTTSSSTTRTPTCRGGCAPPAGRSGTSRRRCCATCTRRPAPSGRRCGCSTSTATGC